MFFGGSLGLHELALPLKDGLEGGSNTLHDVDGVGVGGVTVPNAVPQSFVVLLR
eukprot:CAMPEP_0206522814 /NCGR_PEP_ID=MMETSP0324_2-20121206/67215_1 /ASSEMBLY_ACC=CAM_ASM_000836 /TAXON_ID=2866 /ORGANISM="Crypthecodinium cohnii, Strain Seligo" /LENGTH=53 /DNA_ID=CAMNT_0054017067 /DNA_START=83 /DNA_END=240 /DNA_ORIENTATION=-